MQQKTTLDLKTNTLTTYTMHNEQYLEMHFVGGVAHQKQRLILQMIGRHEFAQSVQCALGFGGAGAGEAKDDWALHGEKQIDNIDHKVRN